MTKYKEIGDATGKWEVFGYDTFSREGWHSSTHESKEDAHEKAKKSGGQMTLMYVQDPEGNVDKNRYGTF